MPSKKEPEEALTPQEPLDVDAPVAVEGPFPDTEQAAEAADAPESSNVVAVFVGSHNQGESLFAVPNKDLTVDEWEELPEWARASVRASHLFHVLAEPQLPVDKLSNPDEVAKG